MEAFEHVELTSERLIFKRIHPELHAKEIHTALLETMDSVEQWVPWAKHDLTVEDTKLGLKRTSGDTKHFSFRLYKKEDANKMIGACGIVFEEEFPKTYEIGYWITQSCENKGYTTEACKTVSQYAIENLKVQKFTLCTDKRNTGSCRIAEKLGFHLSREEESVLNSRPDWGKHTLLIYEKLL